MNWDTIFWIASSVLGAASIVGGIVAYRGGNRLAVRAPGAGLAAAGVVMLSIVISTVPVSSTSG